MPFSVFTGYQGWVIKFNGLSGDSGQRGPYSSYKPCNRSLYIGIIIFPNIDYNLQATINIKKKGKELKKKWGHPLSWQTIGEKESGSVHRINLQPLNYNPNTETRPYAAIICQAEEIG